MKKKEIINPINPDKLFKITYYRKDSLTVKHTKEVKYSELERDMRQLEESKLVLQYWSEEVR